MVALGDRVIGWMVGVSKAVMIKDDSMLRRTVFPDTFSVAVIVYLPSFIVVLYLLFMVLPEPTSTVSSRSL